VSGQTIRGLLKKPASTQIPQGQSVTYTDFVTYLPSFGDEDLLPLLEAKGVEVMTEPEQSFSWGALILNALPFIVLHAIRWPIAHESGRGPRFRRVLLRMIAGLLLPFNLGRLAEDILDVEHLHHDERGGQQRHGEYEPTKAE